MTPSLEMVNIDNESEKMAASYDWSGRGSRSRGSSTISTSSGDCFEELRTVIQSLAAGVHSSGEVMRCEQVATTNAIAHVGTDVKSVVSKVDIIQEEVGATKKILEKTNLSVEKVEVAIQEHAKTIPQMEDDIAKMNAGESSERTTRRRKAMESDP